MKWYDIVAPIYDRNIDRTYLPYRQAAIQALRLRPGLTILDLGCGTGLNFAPVLAAIGTRGTLIGIDSSKKMLDIACRKVDHNIGENVHLLPLDARNITRNNLESLTGSRVKIDRIICTLGFSVLPDWRVVFERSFDLLESGGRYCIMDIFNDSITLRTRLVRVLAHADNSRRVWEPLQIRCPDYTETRYPVTHGDVVVVATGTKPPKV